MLDNLPYYTVKELKVYDRSSEKKPTHGEGDGEERLCDGCGLKREYSRGYIANMEAAGEAKTAIWLVSSVSTTLTILESRYSAT